MVPNQPPISEERSIPHIFYQFINYELSHIRPQGANINELQIIFALKTITHFFYTLSLVKGELYREIAAVAKHTYLAQEIP